MSSQLTKLSDSSSAGTILYPLRASAGWFESPKTLEAFGRHLRLALLCYDRIWFQDGIYNLMVTERGDFEMPVLGDLTGQERSLKFFQDDTVTLSVSKEKDDAFTALIDGPLVRGYKVDFAPVMKAAGLNGVEGVELQPFHLSPKGSQLMKPLVNADLTDREFVESLPVHANERKYVLKALHEDTFLAAAIRTNVALDHRVSSAMHLFLRRRAQHFAREIAPLVVDQALKLDLLDVRTLPWDEVISIRESHAAIEFRRMIDRIRDKALLALPSIRTEADLRQIVSDEMTREILDEMASRAPVAGSVAVGLVVNLIPGLGQILHGGVSLFDALQEQRSWVSLLGRSRSRHPK